ncbi:MAG TPA: VCBS repeat-containing protein, partial [Acidimicrobiia bacterium]|nr:VCBS repeat-containing protein [Acidimicrobiia bacterium]
ITGYSIDPVAEQPVVGQVVYVQVTAANQGCADDLVSFDFVLPQGASYAPGGFKFFDTPNPNFCYTDTSGNNTVPCPTVTAGANRHVFVGSIVVPGTAPSNPVHWFQVRIPVRFSSAIDAPLSVRATNSLETKTASVGVTVPFQPELDRTKVPSRGDDIALLGSAYTDVGTLPVAWSNDNGSFTVTNYPVGDFSGWAMQPGVKRIVGDFNADGLKDYALVGGPGWQSIPVAFSRGDGRFDITNNPVDGFGALATVPNVKVLPGDYNGDGLMDIALVGGAGWVSVPIAFAAGNGYWNVTNWMITQGNTDFGTWASTDAKPVTGDFNRDGRTDIALVGGPGWNTLPVAFSNGNGTFNVTNRSAMSSWACGLFEFCLYNLASIAREPGAQPIVGDFNADGIADIALVGMTGAFRGRMYTAISYANGSFGIQQRMGQWNTGLFAEWSTTPGVKILSGDFNGDGYTDLALTGPSGWSTIPVASGTGFGDFNVTNNYVANLPYWASQPNVKPVTGDFNGDGWTDIALTGGSGWTGIAVGSSISSGTFIPLSFTTNRFPSWASDPNSTPLSGKLNYSY